MSQPPGNDLVLGQLAGRNGVLGLSRIERDKHLYVCGGTGTGKSKFLEKPHPAGHQAVAQKQMRDARLGPARLAL